MQSRHAIKTSRLAILDHYLREAAKRDEEWSCRFDSLLDDLRRTDPARHSRLLRAIDQYDGQGDPPAGWVKRTYPSIVQKIGRKLDRGRPQCFACGFRFEDWRHGLERAHIIAASSGGQDTPSNYVLLCSDCHLDSPMTNHIDWMLEWVDRGPAAPGWREHDAFQAAIDAEMLAAFNYSRYSTDVTLHECMKYAVVGADVSRENFERTGREVAAEFDAGFHFGQSSLSPATKAYLMLETFGRVALGNREREPDKSTNG